MAASKKTTFRTVHRKLASKAAASKTVVLRSRGDAKVKVSDARDREFLKLADNFVLQARTVQEDPARQAAQTWAHR